jgi:hypothetical protein
MYGTAGNRGEKTGTVRHRSEIRTIRRRGENKETKEQI